MWSIKKVASAAGAVGLVAGLAACSDDSGSSEDEIRASISSEMEAEASASQKSREAEKSVARLEQELAEERRAAKSDRQRFSAAPQPTVPSYTPEPEPEPTLVQKEQFPSPPGAPARGFEWVLMGPYETGTGSNCIQVSNEWPAQISDCFEMSDGWYFYGQRQAAR